MHTSSVFLNVKLLQVLWKTTKQLFFLSQVPASGIIYPQKLLVSFYKGLFDKQNETIDSGIRYFAEIHCLIVKVECCGTQPA